MKRKKIVIIILLCVILCVVMKNTVMKNIECKEGNEYIIYCGAKPMNITHLIEERGYECISEHLIWNPNYKVFTNEQLNEIRNTLPQWSLKHFKNFTKSDESKLNESLNILSDNDLTTKLRYKHSFFENRTSEEVYVFELKLSDGIISETIYCINYKDVYDLYDKPSQELDGFELFPKEEKPYFSIIVSKEEVKNLF